jgi:hypothetical protein
MLASLGEDKRFVFCKRAELHIPHPPVFPPVFELSARRNSVVLKRLGEELYVMQFRHTEGTYHSQVLKITLGGLEEPCILHDVTVDVVMLEFVHWSGYSRPLFCRVLPDVLIDLVRAYLYEPALCSLV